MTHFLTDVATKEDVNKLLTGPSERPKKYVIIDRKSEILNPLLFDLLTYPTPYGHESRISEYVLDVAKSHINMTDAEGNIIVRVGDKSKSTTAFSCHLDTVHTIAVKDETLKLVISAEDLNVQDGFIYAFTSKPHPEKKNTILLTPSVLGADDKVGVYIMLEMIKHKIPGLYIFHVGEERGGKGSEFIAEKTPEVLKDIKRIIAFDRQGYGDVIRFQRNVECCSETFAKALATQLSANTPAKFINFEPCRGIFTDTANYTHLIPECTNISIGYFNNHRTTECFDLVYLTSMLLPAILKVDWENLPIERKPVAKVKSFPAYNRGANNYYYNSQEITKFNWEPKKPLDYASEQDAKDAVDTWIRKNAYNGEAGKFVYKLLKEVKTYKALFDLEKVVKIVTDEEDFFNTIAYKVILIRQLSNLQKEIEKDKKARVNAEIRTTLKNYKTLREEFGINNISITFLENIALGLVSKLTFLTKNAEIAKICTKLVNEITT